LPSVATWVYPCLGVTQYNKQNTEKAKASLATVLSFINQHLSTVTYLVGERISQADITIFTAVYLLMKHVLDPTQRKPYPHLVRWFTTMVNQPQVKSVVGDFEFCEKEAQFDAKKFAELHPNEKAAAGKEAKSQKKAAPQAKDADDEDKPAPPAKNPIEALPKGTFDMDEFKRTYCNNDIKTVGIPYFWKHFDPSAYSIWTCEYMYPEELGMLFMTGNLVSGMFQRMEKLNKFAFGCMAIFGVDSNNSIKGLWVWRGTDFLFDVAKDFAIDSESYEWKKLDHTAESTKKTVEEFFTFKFADPSFDTKKIFK